MLSHYGISCYGCAFFQISFGLEREKIKSFFGSFFFLLFLRCGLSCLWFLIFLVYVAVRATVCYLYI